MDHIAKQAAKVLRPLKTWSHNCHGASIKLVQAGIGSRVVRGTCPGVGSQHSWVIIGNNCYDRAATIVDPTLWSYRNDVKGVFIGTVETYGHRPHGTGSIWEWGKPVRGSGPTIKLTPRVQLSAHALSFLSMVEPLDREGWARLANAPVEEWPAAEILAAIDDTEELMALVPIDRIGMLTDRNPGGLYLPARN